MVVDAGGNGDYTTVQEAINAVPDNSSARTRIYIKNGTYNEKVAISSSKIKVSLIGESLEGVIITWADHNEDGVMTTAESYTLWSDGEDSYLENLTIRNTAGSSAGQAVALRTTGDKTIVNNCKLTGFQDTFYAHQNRQYIFKTYVNGGTDFVFGDATAVLDSCNIECLQGGSFISAPSDTKLVSSLTGEDGNKFTFYKGLQFRNCEIIAGVGVSDNSYYLARPWQPNASSVFITCKMGSHIKPIGWSTWSNDNHLSGFYGEYHSMDLEGNAIDVSQRADWSHQITDFNYKYYNPYSSIEGVISYPAFYRNVSLYPNGDYDWSPYDTLRSLSPPTGFYSGPLTVYWFGVDGAIGYAVYRDGEMIGFTESNSFEDTSASYHTTYQYTVRSIKNTGGIGDLSGSYSTVFYPTAVQKIVSAPLRITVSKSILSVSEPVEVTVYAITGQMVRKLDVSKSVDLGNLKGIFLIKATTKNNKTTLKRVII